MTSEIALDDRTALVMAGVPKTNNALYWQIRFLVGDPAVWLNLPLEVARQQLLILRDIELDRARQQARVDVVACPAD